MKNVFRNLVVAVLTAEARLALAVHRPKIVAVTGNLGKTTTKDAIYAAVSTRISARKSQKSFNSEIGVPLTILDLDNPWSNPFKWTWALIRGLLTVATPNYPKLLVLEVGADKPGDISSIAAWLKPDIVVYTGVPEIPVHIAHFDSREALVNEKRALLKHMKPNGVAVVNGADLEEATRGVTARVVSYGFESGHDVAGSNVRIMFDQKESPIGMSAQVLIGGVRSELHVNGALGKPFIQAALAALAVARELGIDMQLAIRAIGEWRTAPGRMRILSGVNGSCIIDDSYNSSPAAAASALDTLSEIPSTRKIAVLGDMRELGAESERAHREIGQHAAKTVDLLITVGEESKVLAQAAREAGMAPERVREYGYGEAGRAGKALAREVHAGDSILVKGSQNKIRLECCVRELLEDPSQAKTLLVRQDTTWLKKK